MFYVPFNETWGSILMLLATVNLNINTVTYAPILNQDYYIFLPLNSALAAKVIQELHFLIPITRSRIHVTFDTKCKSQASKNNEQHYKDLFVILSACLSASIFLGHYFTFNDGELFYENHTFFIETGVLILEQCGTINLKFMI